jgi:hypothetical protein
MLGRRAFKAVWVFAGADGGAKLEDIVVRARKSKAFTSEKTPTFRRDAGSSSRIRAVELRVVSAPGDFDFPGRKRVLARVICSS